MKVIKRNGSEVDFDVEKIIVAITKANNANVDLYISFDNEAVGRMMGEELVKAGVKDVLAQRVNFKQFNNVVTADGQHKEVQEVTRSYRPGRNISLSLTYRL